MPKDVGRNAPTEATADRHGESGVFLKHPRAGAA